MPSLVDSCIGGKPLKLFLRKIDFQDFFFKKPDEKISHQLKVTPSDVTVIKKSTYFEDQGAEKKIQ